MKWLKEWLKKLLEIDAIEMRCDREFDHSINLIDRVYLLELRHKRGRPKKTS